MTPEEIEADVAAIDTWIGDYEDVAARKARLCLNRAWEHYGVDSWDALCRERGWNRPLTLEQRQQEVVALRQQGMSTRAIASAVGVHHSTVADDLATVGNPTVETVTSLDGRTRPATRPEVITAEEFVERYDNDNEPTPDLDTLIPTDQRFRLRFAKRLLATHDLLTDMDYPQYFDDEMAERLARFVDNLTRKHTEFSKSRRTLRVVQGGNP